MRKCLCAAIGVVSLVGLYQCGGSGQGAEEDQKEHETAKEDYELSIDWENIPDGRIFQRDANGTYSLVIKGTFRAQPQKIEARVVQAETGQEVVAWTQIISMPLGAKFQAALPGIPQGGWYQIQIRVDANNVTEYRDTPRFGVGVLIACLGQSHIDGWFDPKRGDPEEKADARLRMYRHQQVRQAGPNWIGWQPVTGLAATVFGNSVIQTLDVPIGLLDYGVQAASLWQANSLMRAFGWWLADESGVHPQSDNYSVFVEGRESIGQRVEAVLWIQGHTDAMKAESTEHYQLGLETFMSTLRQDSQHPDLPVFFSLVARQGPSFGVFKTTPDEDIQAIRDAERGYIEGDPNTYLGCTTMDLPLDSTQVHHSAEGKIIQAQRMALAVTSVLDHPTTNAYRGPRILGYRIVDQKTLDISIQHVRGNDFTPRQGIQGFRVQGNGVGEITAAFRQNASTIRITITGDTNNISHVDYLYGGNPGDMDLQSYVDSYVHDNTTLQLPLEGGAVSRLS